MIRNARRYPASHKSRSTVETTHDDGIDCVCKSLAWVGRNSAIDDVRQCFFPDGQIHGIGKCGGARRRLSGCRGKKYAVSSSRGEHRILFSTHNALLYQTVSAYKVQSTFEDFASNRTHKRVYLYLEALTSSDCIGLSLQIPENYREDSIVADHLTFP